MANTANKTITVSAEVISINPEIKTKSNGKPYQSIKIRFTDKDSPLYNLTYFAQRTLGNDQEGNPKKEAKIGDIATCHGTLVNGTPFFEISLGVTDKDTIAAAFA